MESNLEEFRDKINKIDLKLLELLSERQTFVDKVSQVKSKKLTSSFIMPRREKEMMKRLIENSNLNQNMVEYIWRGIISNSLYSEQNFTIHISSKIINDELSSYFPYFIPKITYKNTQMEIAKIKENKGDLIVIPYTEIVENYKTLNHFGYLCFKNLTKDKSLIFARIDKEFLAKDRFIYIIDEANIKQIAKILHKDKHINLIETTEKKEFGFFLGSY
jgi:chorismate mutase